MRKVLALTLAIAMIFTMSIGGVLWAIADNDEYEMIIAESIEDDQNVIDSGDSEEIARESADNTLIETEWEWIPPLEFGTELPQRSQLTSSRPTLPREFAIEIRDRLNEEIEQAEIMPRKMAQMVQLEMNNLENTERSEFNYEADNVHDQRRAPFYIIWQCPLDSSGVAFDEYGYPIAPYLLRNQVVFNQATGEFMWNNFVIDHEDLRYFKELSMLFERRDSIQPNNAVNAGMARFSASGPTIVDYTPIIDIFPDPRLALEMARRLAHPSDTTAEITQDDLDRVTWISLFLCDVTYGLIESLEGVQYLRNLTDIHANFQNISDLTPLAELSNLSSLNFRGNQIYNISPLHTILNSSSLWMIDLSAQNITLPTVEWNNHLRVLNMARDEHLWSITPYYISDNGEVVGNSIEWNISRDVSHVSYRWNQGVNGEWWLGEFSGTVTLPINATEPYLGQIHPELFPDQRLAQEVVRELNRRTIGGRNNWTLRCSVVQSQLNLISDLSIVGIAGANSRINNLEGIQHLWRLRSFTATSQNIRNLEPLSTLAILTSTSLTNLTYLNLSNNQISDIRGLRNLTDMRALNLSGNQISNFSQLSHMHRLETLNLSRNNISNHVEIRNFPNLRYLNLSYNQITGFSVVGTRTSIETLNLNNNNIANISELHSPNLPNLWSLNLANNRIICVESLSSKRNLSWLNLSNNDIDCIEPLAGATNLWTLYLDNNRIIDIYPLAGLPSLWTLRLRNNQIRDVSPLAGDFYWMEILLCGNQISDLSPLSEIGVWMFEARNQRITQRVSSANPLIVQNIVKDVDGNFIAPSSSSPQWINYNQANGEITWNALNSATYSWNDAQVNANGWVFPFSGMVIVQVVNPQVPPTEPITVFPTVDLFVRNDTGLNPQESNTYTYRRHNGLTRFYGTDLQIGTNHAANSPIGAYRESIVRFDLTPQQIDRIKNASGVGNDRIIFQLFVTGAPYSNYITSALGNAQTRAVSLHLLPGYRVARVHTNYPRWNLEGNNVVRHVSQSLGMSAWDAYRAQITARGNFRNITPTRVSDPIHFNHPQYGSTRLNEFFDFDLTDALKAYFNNNPNATSFAFVLSNLNENGLITAASSRAIVERRPRLILPANVSPVVVPTPVSPELAVFVRSDSSSNLQTAANIRNCHHLSVSQSNTHLVIGSSNNANAPDGAYRETFMRFELDWDHIQGILNASSVGNDRAVLNLGILRTDNTLAPVRAVNVHLLDADKVEEVYDGMTYFSAFEAGITVRDFLRNQPPAARSEYIFTRSSRVPYTRLNRYFEFDLTEALQNHFRDHPAGTSGSFAIALSSLQGYDLVVVAGMEHGTNEDNLRPRLMLPAGGALERQEVQFIALNKGDIVSIPITVSTTVDRLNNMGFSLGFNEVDLIFHSDSHNLLDSENFTFNVVDNPSILASWTTTGIVNAVNFRAMRDAQPNNPITVIVDAHAVNNPTVSFAEYIELNYEISEQPEPTTVFNQEFHDAVMAIIQENWQDDFFASITMTIGENNMNIDGREIEIEMAAEFIGDELVLPIADIAEAIGEEVVLDARGRTGFTNMALKTDVEQVLNLDIQIDDDRIVITRPYQTRQLIVRTYKDYRLTETYGAIYALDDSTGYHFFMYHSEEEAKTARQLLNEHPNVMWAFPNVIASRNIDWVWPSEHQIYDSLFDRWGSEHIGSDAFIAYLEREGKTTGREIRVAVIDTDVDIGHPIFLNREGETRIRNARRANPRPHGTHVAGIIANNTPDNVLIIPMGVNLGWGHYSSAYAVRNMIFDAVRPPINADIINLSIYIPSHYIGIDSIFQPAIDYAVNSGVVVVVAAGNSGRCIYTFRTFPASFPNVITVAAMGRDNRRGFFRFCQYCVLWRYNSQCSICVHMGSSNHGNLVDIAAPGVGVLSALHGAGDVGRTSYFFDSGTSMAAPFVSAAVAMIMLDNPGASPELIREILLKTVHVPPDWNSGFLGSGMLNLNYYIRPEVIITTPSLRLTGASTFTLDEISLSARDLFIGRNVSVIVNKGQHSNPPISVTLSEAEISIPINNPMVNTFTLGEYIEILVYDDDWGYIARQIAHPVLFNF